jgi:hypothetical protein
VIGIVVTLFYYHKHTDHSAEEELEGKFHDHLVEEKLEGIFH